ncbi:hypothetical protein BDV98DRAFT_636156 [Pterulicium gracile]|uniref:Uncharacterized protein n=1 Tax=Pterulicium gracile TaxID=1884261 RepID=A0A5C3Q5L4_9AGAR|nr:hypothetical protein BDV98DRAFT_636156 [Pterula gracilis]
METIYPVLHPPNAGFPFTVTIPKDQKASKEIGSADTSVTKIYCNRSGLNAKAGAASVITRLGHVINVSHYHLGTLTKYTTFDAKAVGVSLALQQLLHAVNPGRTTICLNNQAVLLALHQHVPKTGQFVMTKIHKLINDAYRKHLQLGEDFGLDVRWITGHTGVKWNEMADVEVKEASGGKVSGDVLLPLFLCAGQQLPISVGAECQKLEKECKMMWREQ